MQAILDIFLNLDEKLTEVVAGYGPWVYGLLFAIVFCETGLVVFPFLPGDSLLFAVGALGARPDSLDLAIAVPVLYVAAVIGDNVNYFIGRAVGPRVFQARPEGSPRSWKERFFRQDHLSRAHAFFEKHGGKSVIAGHFIPIVRTFVPFVAGASAMSYRWFLFCNVTGVALWVGVCTAAGYFFGNRTVVKENFSLVVLGVVAVSLLPAAIQIIRGFLRRPDVPARVAAVADRPPSSPESH